MLGPNEGTGQLFLVAELFLEKEIEFVALLTCPAAEHFSVASCVILTDQTATEFSVEPHNEQGRRAGWCAPLPKLKSHITFSNTFGIFHHVSAGLTGLPAKSLDYNRARCRGLFMNATATGQENVIVSLTV